jgi:predicted nucleic acid-binding protein
VIHGLTFVDTNVLLYSEDGRETDRRDVAAGVLRDLWTSGLGVLSTQVLQQFYDNATRKLKMPPESARRIVAQYAEWPVVEGTAQLIVSASVLHEQHGFAFWDAMIVEAALLSGATTLLSEDMQDGRRIGSLVIRNPFRPPDSEFHPSTGGPPGP